MNTKSTSARATVRWIGSALDKEKKGALHKEMGVPLGQKIPIGKLKEAAKKDGKIGARARLALTLRSFKK